MTDIIWVHEDALRDDHPVRAAASNARAVFIWDEDYFRAQNYSAKRLIFIAECLADMNVDVFKGETKEVLRQLSDGAEIFTAATPNPEYLKIIDALNIHVSDDIPLARIDPHADLGRFFRYWKKAGKSVMGHNGLPGGQEDLFS